jgi:glycosyltransferase involved in cell wall biosynthesis
MEAMSVGMPCITNDSGGCREIIKNNKNGIIIRNINVKSLSKEIIKLLTNDKLRGRLGKAATQVTKTFSLQKMSARYRKLLSL